MSTSAEFITEKWKTLSLGLMLLYSNTIVELQTSAAVSKHSVLAESPRTAMVAVRWQF